MKTTDYNPDVLTCLANLSNDEVFTPPILANQMLDILPTELWSNPDIRFLDPVCKSGVFLREIAKRLIKGLETKIPDMQERCNHIFKNQLFGIAITELTSLLSRRSVYCTKTANNKYSVCETFDNKQGNIRYERIQHTWGSTGSDTGKCQYCGASKEVYDRNDETETYAYNFIHTDKPENIFNMKFDVIIGNPPYQLNVGVEQESYAIPLYHLFVQQSKKLKPRYLIMIIPARWFSGGRGLDDFRNEMLKDNRIRIIYDFPNSSDCFPGVEIKGGVCFFLWNRDEKGLCKIVSFENEKIISQSERKLLEENCDTFIRYNQSISILNKVRAFNEKSFSFLVSPQTPFGLISSFKKYQPNHFENSVKVYVTKGYGYMKREHITKGIDMVDGYKIYITKSYGAGEGFPHQILNKPFIGEKNSCCTQTYLIIYPFESEGQAQNAISYIRTKFFRFIVLLKKNTQDAMRGVYEFVPLQDFSEPWTDEKLYAKYGLTEDEIAFIESMIRPMDLNTEENEK